MLFLVSVPNFVQMRVIVTELAVNVNFKMAAAAILNLLPSLFWQIDVFG